MSKIMEEVDGRMNSYLHDLPPQAALDLGILRGRVDRLEQSLGWAIGYIEYEDVIPSPERDEREGESDARCFTEALEALK